MQDLSYLGFGIGLRPIHYQAIIDSKPAIDWFEIVSEDFMVAGGAPLYYLDKICENYPIVMHGVSLSIASSDPLNWDYLHKLKTLIERVEPRWVSDHLCWTGVNGINLHGLLPLPFTTEAVNYVAERIQQVQDFLGRQILMENISSYIDYSISEMTEWEYVSEVAEKADCLILFDVNNAYVNGFNHGFNAMDFVNGLPAKRVQQFHMAGHDNCQTHIVDTHDNTIIDDVWTLYEASIKRFGAVSTLIERDDCIPSIDEMLIELNQARTIFKKVQEQEIVV